MSKRKPLTPEQKELRNARMREYVKRPEVADRIKVNTWAHQLATRAKQRTKVQGYSEPCEITTEWVKERYRIQRGLCHYTGLPMVIDTTYRGMRRPSLDRKDPNRGYTKDNVVLCMWSMNAAKQLSGEKDLLKLLSDIKGA